MDTTKKLIHILEGCVLMVLKDKCLNFHEICKEFRDNGLKDVEEGILYPILLKLESESLLDIDKKVSEEEPICKYYTLNKKGRTQLNEYQVVWSNLRVIIDNLMGGFTIHESR